MDERFVALAQTGVLVKGTLRPRDAFPEVPLFSDLLAGRLDAPARAAFARWLATTQIGKFFAAPPGTPPALLALYREGFRAMSRDPHFQDIAAAELAADYALTSADDLARTAADLAAMPESELTLLRDLKRRYG